jgi:hypothetical protein
VPASSSLLPLLLLFVDIIPRVIRVVRNLGRSGAFRIMIHIREITTVRVLAPKVCHRKSSRGLDNVAALTGADPVREWDVYICE